MALTNQERVGKGLELLRAGLAPYVEQETWGRPDAAPGAGVADLGVSGLLELVWTRWDDVFDPTLGSSGRNLVGELRDWCGKWVRREPFSSDDADRALDSMTRLLTAIAAPQAVEVGKLKLELRRLIFDEQVRSERRRVGGSLIEAAATGALKPWREVVTPHPDVACGRYRQAEFAADLWQAHLGAGGDEYCDPREFFDRTYLTASLKRLLVGAATRLSGRGGDPVVQLQTNFGGGKTHAMLALYHLFSGVAPSELSGVDTLLAENGLTGLPANVRRVVLVGNRISPGNPVVKPDGVVVRTLWGELAWQLGGAEAYARIASDDERATNPGDRLRELLTAYGPCLVLIDEWVAYARQLRDGGELPGGTFETQFTFAQALTESVKLAGDCLLVVSLPASDGSGSPHASVEDVEVGGVRGREALDRLRNIVGRLESSWRPASAEESFEIVRRRLFEPLAGPEAFRQRDVTARAFAELYRAHASEFPSECRETDYEQRLRAAYPIHPEIFDRLYADWSTLVKFQRTRGVLRLMAAVIHSLWERGDRNPLILPATIPMDDARVQFELTRYLSDNWAPVLETDIDGPDSRPRRIDLESPGLGKFQATLRVARTIFLGSAPTAGAAHLGLEDQRIKLGCVAPGESPAVFGDALRRLAATATYLYQDGSRFWYATQPTVAKLAEDRAEALRRQPDAASMELERRLRAEFRGAGEFARIHVWACSGEDVPDELETRLVVLPPDHAYHRSSENAAEALAQKILESRGAGPRLYRNTLVFLAADKARWPDLEQSLCRYLAWASIVADKEALNLSPFQARQAETQKRSADETVRAQLPEIYQWALAPEQKTPQSPVVWRALRLSGAEALAARAARRLKSEELLVSNLGSTMLRRHLDETPLWRNGHVAIKQLADDFARYSYLPRLTGPEVLLRAIGNGVALPTWRQDTFAYAEGYDAASGRYLGLCAGRSVALTADDGGLLVRPAVAEEQAARDSGASAAAAAAAVPAGRASLTATDSVSGGGAVLSPAVSASAAPTAEGHLRRFYGAVELDARCVLQDVERVVNEVLTHLSAQAGANVRVTLEIEATLPQGISSESALVVAENSRTLKFKSYGFEET